MNLCIFYHRVQNGGEFLFSVIFLTQIFVGLELLQSLKLVKNASFNDLLCILAT